MQTTQPWASEGAGTKTGQNEVGVTMIGTEVAGLTGVMIARSTVTGIRAIVVIGGRTTEATEADIGETTGQDPGPQGEGHDPGMGVMEDGGDPRRELGMAYTPTSDDGQTTEKST